jgi:hypothetical protein
MKNHVIKIFIFQFNHNNYFCTILKGDDSLPEHVQKFLGELEEINFTMVDQIVGIHKIDSTLFLLNDLV